jgi:membrane protein implicated in regulation of membrane protease activity
MFQFLQTGIVTLIYLIVAGVGAIFMIVSLFFGNDGEVSAETEVGGGPGFFSLRALAVFLTAFGAIGAVAHNYFPPAKGTALISSLLGVMGGVIMSLVYVMAMRMVYSQEASSLVADRDLVGVEGRVTVAIPENGLGEVSCLIGGHVTRRMARARQALPEGTVVRIKEVYGDTVVVEPIV